MVIRYNIIKELEKFKAGKKTKVSAEYLLHAVADTYLRATAPKPRKLKLECYGSVDDLPKEALLMLREEFGIVRP